jgi:CRP/FNR family cyclic AMP-dependent transcriptional regulator
MPMKIDPAVAKIFAENVRAEVIVRPPVSQLDPAIVQKIASRVKVFQGMSGDCLSRTLALAERMHYAANEVIFNEGDIGSAFYVLVAGDVVIEKLRGDRVVDLAHLNAGECFGEMGLVGAHLRTATVRARHAAMALRFERERVDGFAESAHIIYRNIARVLAARLDSSSELLAEMAIRSGETRPVSL